MANNTFCVNLFEQDFAQFRQFALEKAPYSKVLLIALKKDFNKKAQTIIEQLKKNGNKAITILFPDNFIFSVKNVCGIFNTPEDVRLVVSLSDKLISVAYYFAQIKNIPVMLFSDGWKDHLFVDKLFIKNNNNLDYFCCTVDVFVFLDKPFFADFDAFAFVCDERFKLLDLYLTSQYSDMDFDQNIFKKYESLLSEFERLIFGEIFIERKNDFILSLLQVSVDLRKVLSPTFKSVSQVANFFNCSNYAQRLLSAKYVLFHANKILNQSESGVFDYNVSTPHVVDTTGFDEVCVMNNFIKQIKSINKSKGTQIFKEIVGVGCNYFNKAVERIKELGLDHLQLSAKHTRLLKICGDTPLGVNLMTVLREIS